MSDLQGKPAAPGYAEGQIWDYDKQGSPEGSHARLVLLAHDLQPTELDLMMGHLVAVCLRRGTSYGHTAQMALLFGIPMIVALGEVTEMLEPGCPVWCDGGLGQVGPFRQTDEASARAAYPFAVGDRPARPFEGEILTSDGALVTVSATSMSRAQCAGSLEKGYKRVGLFPTEQLFFNSKKVPSEEEHFNYYREILSVTTNICFRTMDIGGDKEMPWLDIAEERNSFLGVRGIRLSLRRDDLFLPQLRGLLRAFKDCGTGPSLLFPMVSTVEELAEARCIVESVSAELGADRSTRVGVMLETPSSIEMIPELSEFADFYAVGTNDLTQYILAMDRTNPETSSGFCSHNPAVLRTIARAITRARLSDIPIAMCGLSAGDPFEASVYVGMGARDLVVADALLPGVLDALSGVTLSQMEQLADRAMKCSRTAQVQLLKESFADGERRDS